MRHVLSTGRSRLGIAGAILAALMAVVALTLVRSASAAPTELFVSEYVEGSSNNKALEIFNGTGAPVALDGVFAVQLYANGSATPTATIALTGTVAAGDVFVLARSTADAAILAAADQTSTNFLWNGNDAVALVKNGTTIDVIGQIGVDPGVEWGTGDTSTADNTLRRKPSVQAGDADGSDTFDPALQWDGLANDTFSGLGAHSIDTGGGGGGGGANTAPVAVDDAVTLEEDGGPEVIAVLANDADSDGDTLTIVSATDPAHGNVSVDGSTLVYVPDVDYAGSDSLGYTISDGHGETDTANVAVTVTPANDDPDAEDDAFSMAEDTSVSVDVLANDEDVDGDTLTITEVDNAAHGSVTVATGGARVLYTPAANYNGPDTFGYTVSDGVGIGEAEVTVTVTAVNDPPVGVADAATVNQGSNVVVDVLANDSAGPTNESGQTLSVASVTAPAHGTAAVITSGADAGKVRYTPSPAYSGADSFSYVVSDGSATATGAVAITVRAGGPVIQPSCNLTATILGTVGDDTLVGTPGDDIIRARRGRDTIDGRGGNDVICGGPGADRITSGDGSDWIAGGTGVDTIDSGAGNDRVRGGFGADSIVTAAGDDRIAAGPGDDDGNAGDGRNAVGGGAGDDRLVAGSGDDRVDGGAGVDSCDADGGHNTLVRCE